MQRGREVKIARRRLPGTREPHPNRVPAEIEKTILNHALEHPCHGSTSAEQALRLKGVGKNYLQTAVDCCSRYAWASYPNKLAVVKWAVSALHRPYALIGKSMNFLLRSH